MNNNSQILSLLKDKPFASLFWVQFLGALNDNFYKQALIILLLFTVANESGPYLVTIAAGLLVLPFFLFSALAGQLADRYPKASLTRLVKISEIVIVLVGSLAFFTQNITLMFVVLFALGMQSAMFGPIKFGIIPDLVKKDELMSANALVEAGTFLAILIGTSLGGYLMAVEGGISFVSAGTFLVAVAGYYWSRSIPHIEPKAPDLKLSFNFAKESFRLCAYLFEQRRLGFLALGISWFWFFGAVILAQTPDYVKNTLLGNEEIATTVLVVFSVGIGLGSLAVARLTKGSITLWPVPFAALVMSLCAIDLYLATGSFVVLDQGEQTLASFLVLPSAWRILADLTIIAMAGGVFVVPLFTGLQHFADPAKRARVIAALNILSAIFVVGSSVITIVLQLAGFKAADLFLALGIANLPVVLLSFVCLPQHIQKSCLSRIFTWIYSLKCYGFENVKGDGNKVIYLVQHRSTLDPLLLLSVLGQRWPCFVIDPDLRRSWLWRLFSHLFNGIVIEPGQTTGIRRAINHIKDGSPLFIFPKADFAEDGTWLKAYDVPALIADKAGAQISFVRIDGAEQSPFTLMKKGHVRSKSFPRITISFAEPQIIDLKRRSVRTSKKEQLSLGFHDLINAQKVLTDNTDRTIDEAFWRSAKKQGLNQTAAEDADGNKITYRRILAGSAIIASWADKEFKEAGTLGIMLPNAPATLVTFLGLLQSRHTPAMINFTTGASSILRCCEVACIKSIITSRRFEKEADLQSLFATLKMSVRLIYLEDVLEGVSKLAKVKAAILAGREPGPKTASAAGETAVILFTSGSEGAPKGVVLSHKNLLINCAQSAASIDYTVKDKVFNILPMFHSFGLMGATLVPVLYGVGVVFYPSPLHYQKIPEAIFQSRSTVLFGVDTFLAGYARRAHINDFHHLRLVFAGAEKLKQSTKQLWMDKFGIRIMEAYGMTEASPAVSLNTPAHYKSGTVGRAMPLVEVKLIEVEEADGLKRLVIRGPNLMRGYMKLDKPGVLQESLDDGWFLTGDIASIDDQDYLEIKGRLSRFAKIGGEMVSFAAIENLLSDLSPECHHIVHGITDQRKGEKLVLLTTDETISREKIVAHFKKHVASELSIPSAILKTDTIPLLRTGKADIRAAVAMIRELTETT